MKAQIQVGSVLKNLPVHADNINSIVIFDDDAQPLMAIEQIGDATIRVVRADEPTFGAALARLRVNEGVPHVISG